jgi:hypothetical protein
VAHHAVNSPAIYAPSTVAPGSKTIGGELRYVPDKANSIGFTDHSGNPWSASRPGFRIKVGDSRKAQHDAIADYNKEISNRWKCGDRQSVCSSCFGTGLDPTDGTFCINCAGEGVTDDAYESSPDEAAADTAADRAPDIRHRSLDEMMKSHRERMTSLYDAYDKSISEQWRHR